MSLSAGISSDLVDSLATGAYPLSNRIADGDMESGIDGAWSRVCGSSFCRSKSGNDAGDALVGESLQVSSNSFRS